ncbi:MAG TPA: NAD(P)-binding domain-containing protein [Cyclobacteriaceae bacterium]
MTKNKIGILGSGMVAQVLGSGFIKHGYEVMIGSREPAKLNDWKSKAGAKASVGTFEDTAAFGEIIVLAVKGSVVEALATSLASSLAGKTIIDPTNPIAAAAPENGVLRYFTDINLSLMERLQKAVPAGNFVKAFNSVGSTFMVNPKFPGGRPTMFIAGNNEAAKSDVKVILEKFEWDIADMGGVEAARAIEPLCMLWCIPGILRGEWATHAFKLLKV